MSESKKSTGRRSILEQGVEHLFDQDPKALVLLAARVISRTMEFHVEEKQAEAAYSALLRRELLACYTASCNRSAQTRTEATTSTETRSAPEADSRMDESNGIKEQLRRLREERETLNLRRQLVREQQDFERERLKLEAEELALKDLREGRFSPESDEKGEGSSADCTQDMEGCIEEDVEVFQLREADHGEADLEPWSGPDREQTDRLIVLYKEARKLQGDPETALSKIDQALKIFRDTEIRDPRAEGRALDFKRQILDLAIEICSTNRFVARLKNYADDLLVATGRALCLDPTVDHSLNHSLALVIQGDYALLANRLDEAKARFVEAHRLLPSLKTETTEDDRARLDLVVSIEKRMETLQSRRGGSLH